MTNALADSDTFEEVVRNLLADGLNVRFQARGASMSPVIRDGETVEVTPVIVSKLRKDDIVLTMSSYGFRLHRLVVADPANDIFVTRGDCGQENDPALTGSQILGLAQAKDVKVGKRIVQARFRGVMGRTLRCAARGQYVVGKLLKGVVRSAVAAKAGMSLGMLVLLLSAAAQLNAQVAFDRTANLAGNSYCTGAGTCSFTWQQQVSNTSSNYILVVTVSLNIKNSPSSSVSGITYNGIALKFQGAHNDAQSIMRTEIWTLVAPPTGANHNVVMSVNNPAAATIGVMAGSASFSGVDQTVPVGGYVANDGGTNANTGYSMLDVPSVVQGMVVDALAAGGQNITVPAPETKIYTQQSSNQTSATNVYGAAAYEAGAPSIPMAETFTINGGEIPNWSESGISLNPSQADIGVKATVTPVQPGTNSVYNITVYNNGPSAAAAVKLVDTLGTGTTYVSYTASAGVSCTDAGATLTCTVGALAANATATVALTVSTTAAGFYPNTAVVSDSGTPPDYNLGNNTYVAVAPVQTVVCATSNLTVGGTLSGVINTYYPGSATVAEGATLIPVGTATGAGATIASGTELLVIQMQNASINDSNSIAYGNGFTGQGFTAVNTAGNYEFLTATGPISGGSIPIHGAGPGGGLIFTYTSAAWSANAGASAYQVVVVPQYSSATLSSGLTALPWNGSTGGILAMDVAGVLTLGNATVNMDGMGFRGAAGLSLVGENGAANTDYEFAAPATYTTPALNNLAITVGADGSKGEGIAGTPLWVQAGTTPFNTGSGYPSGTAGKDGSMGRGAPGNAGGGATDGAPTAAGQNNDNAGGGGGGNGGAGGFGGNAYGNNLSSGGEGGVAFPVTVNRFAMGGGGGAGSNNYYQDSQDSSGGAGGGMIFIRADSLSGSATLTANGIGAYTGTSSNAGGGGGAGGSIVVVSANGGETGLTLHANGGTGGGNQGCTACGTQTFLQGRIGPGAGGGGGAVYTSSVSGLPAISVTGGANGLTQDTSSTPVPYGATSGTAGVSVTNVTLAQLTGLQSTALCTPDMTLSKNHGGGTLTRGTNATYTIPVSNVSPYGASSGVVTMNDTLPLGITPISATGTGWSCSVSGQTVSCVRSDSLPAASSYPSITVNVNVSQSAPSTITNTAVIAGGGEANLLNDMASDVASTVSIADLAVTDAGSPNPVAAGSNITYTQVVTNNGPSAADNATLVANVPANTTFVSLTAPAGWSCITPGSGGTGNAVCANVQMAGSTAATFTMVVKVNSGTANGTVITGNAAVSSSVSDPNTSNNSASASTVVGTTAGGELTVTNVASPNPVQAGSNITYTQVVTNTGSAAATGATFTEATPANTTFVSITPPAGWTCTGFPGTPCSDASVAAGSSGTFTVVYTVNGGTASGTTITDTATVNATNQGFGSNSALATDIVASGTQADLALATAATPSTLLAGNDITYTQTVKNNGPAASTGASMTEATPTNTTFVSVSAPVGWTCTTPAVGATGNVTCNDGSALASSSSADIIVVVNVAPAIAAGTITATSTVTATTSDPNLANNTTTTSTPLTDACDLSVTNTGSPNPVAAGGNITYTQVITNSGPSSCSTATFSEATPTNTTFVSAGVVNSGGASWSCPNSAPVACSASTVPPNSTATITAVYTVGATVTSGTIITDTATVATTTRDTNTANNTATSSIAVASGTQADLSVTNSASPNPVSAGSNITYTQTVTNNGPATAAAPKLVETLPANTTAVSLTGPAGWSCTPLSALTCTDGSTMGANTNATFAFVVTLNTNVAAGTNISQTDTVSSTTSDPNLGNNSGIATVQVADSADMAIKNVASPVPVQAGNNITYTQVVTNNGPSTATSASMTETTPANTTFQSITIPTGWGCTTPAVGGTGTINCTDASFAPGSSSFTVVLKVNAGVAAGTAINDTATVSSAITDTNTANNTATAADVVATATQADLVTTNVASPTSVAAGSNVTYTQAVTNNGPAATAASMTFTQATPPNTNFQSITAPSGWTCTTPSVGGTGTITCTDGGTLAANTTANFTLVLQVNAGTPSGTNITDTATATTTNIVPSITTNTVSASVVVANANSADMAIVKTASPNPVTEGDPLTYSLAVTNNGPAQATNVTVTDALPSSETYLSVTTTQGTCSEAGGTVTCLLGSMANAGTATISILTIPGQPGTIMNTANVTADQVDPNLTNNTSTQVETVTAPTRITLQSFSAHMGSDRNGASRAVLTWKTGGEAHNLGFNVYREQNGNRVRLNPSLIAGSALLMNGALPKHSGRSYAWIDPSAPSSGASYWLEDVDLNGMRTLHGPVTAQAGAPSESDATAGETRMVSQMNQAQPVTPLDQQSHMVETLPGVAEATAAQRQKQFELAANPAVKIFVRHEGWYRVTQPELIAAGLDPNVDPAELHLYAEAIEQPMQITGASVGSGGFGAQAAIQFYGTGIDTPFSGARVYWLVAEPAAGARMQRMPASSGSNQPPADYYATVELQQHTTYIPALLTADDENFFGALVSSTPAEQILRAPHFDSSSTLPTRIEIVLQGVVTAFPHDVLVTLNGTTIGNINYAGQAKGTLNVNLPPGLLQPWDNTVTLTANGDYDYSLVDYIRITYPSTYTADADELKFTGRPGDELTVAGFTSAPVVLDITDPSAPVQLTPHVNSNGSSYEISLQVPWTTTNPAAPKRHTLLAIGQDQIAAAAAVRPNHPSHWHSAQAGANIAMITYEGFAAALAPLVKAHQAEGKTSAIVPVNDLYDEFTFGEHSPFALRQFLRMAVKNWQTPPTYLLLNGRASLDPRNYLGFGHLDLVPTRILPTTNLMTSSDDWFSDFNDTGMPTIATGRLPVGTTDDATTVVGKIVAYEDKSTNGSWTSQAMFVADKDDTESFTQDSLSVQSQLPSTMQVTDVFNGVISTSEAQQDIINGINSGQLLVNYLGHGSEEQWSGSDIFDENSLTSLTNSTQLPVFLIMDCLNGFFQDVYNQPLGAALLLAPNGGAVAVLASSGLNTAAPQIKLDKLVVQNSLNAARPTLGESVVTAKSKIGDPSVRRTFILFGDPAMQVKQLGPTSASH